MDPLGQRIVLPSHLVVALGLCLGMGGCFGMESALVQRASAELVCPPEQISIVHHADIAYSVYDVGACGERARYSCLWIDSDTVVGGAQCVREPDPRRWDPDPLLLGSLPGVSGHLAASGFGGRELLRICAPAGDDGCFYRDAAGAGPWRWREPQTSTCSGMTCQ
jgi:hypothetical protein